MRKILHLTPLYFNQRSCLGGGERYPLNLARGIVQASGGNYQVDVISFDRAPRQIEVERGVKLRLLTAAHFTNPLRVLSWELADVIADADLVHIHQAAMRASEATLLVAKQQRKPVCVTDHGSLTSEEGVFWDRLELADQIVCYSDYGKSLLHTRTPIEVIKGGVDGAYFCPPSRPPVRDRFLYVGRLVPYKSVDQLILALPPDLPLTVCGYPYHAEYFWLLRSLARGKKVQFILDANDEQVRDLYRRAWANVLPTRSEDCYGNLQPAPELMGLTLLEAMACGTPAICSRAGAMPEFVQHGETGFVFHNRAELTAQLQHLANQPAEVERMGQQARQAIEQQFDLLVVGRKLVRLYERIISTGSEAAA
jgi:glycosyltransferase involved in cell wall biosynthesis